MPHNASWQFILNSPVSGVLLSFYVPFVLLFSSLYIASSPARQHKEAIKATFTGSLRIQSAYRESYYDWMALSQHTSLNTSHLPA